MPSLSSLSFSFVEALPPSTFHPNNNATCHNFKLPETSPSSSSSSSAYSVPGTTTKRHPSGSLRLTHLSSLPTATPSALVPFAVFHHQGPQDEDAPALDNHNGSELDSQPSLPLPQVYFTKPLISHLFFSELEKFCIFGARNTTTFAFRPEFVTKFSSFFFLLKVLTFPRIRKVFLGSMFGIFLKKKIILPCWPLLCLRLSCSCSSYLLMNTHLLLASNPLA